MAFQTVSGLCLLAFLVALGGCHPEPGLTLPDDHPLPEVETGRSLLEEVAVFYDSMPTGVAVSTKGRIFVSFPRFGDPLGFTLAEIRHGKAEPFPTLGISRYSKDHPRETLVSVQAVVLDAQDRLWALDTGSIQFAPPISGGAKLVGIDLRKGVIFKTIPLGPDVVLPSTYLNDVRLDLSAGKEGTAYITDSSDHGPNAIIVLDLATGKAKRRLNDHPSTKADPGFVAFVEGRSFLCRTGAVPPRAITTGCDGIALSPNGDRLYYSALAGRRLYSVPTEALRQEPENPEELARLVRDEGMKPASDGMVFDREGRLYMTAYEYSAIVRRRGDGLYETVVTSPFLRWPDSLAISAHGWLYVTSNELHRQAAFQDGHDRRRLPYRLLRLPIEGYEKIDPATLGASTEDLPPSPEAKP